MRSFFRNSIALAAAVLFLSFAAQDAQARIKCKGEFQIVKGHGYISTPYCQDTNLANVARSYGFKVSSASVRNNPSVKIRICYVIGHDIRVTSACAGYRPDGGRGRF